MAILVIEDDIDVRLSVSYLLRREGFVVDAAGDGEEAWRYLASHAAPSLVILDLGLPRVDGATLRRRMLADPTLARVPVVILSAQKSLASRAAELGACEFLGKPFVVDELLHVVQNRAVTVPRAEHFLRGALRGDH
jgi:DNA-binding response OmpR family regulator